MFTLVLSCQIVRDEYPLQVLALQTGGSGRFGVLQLPVSRVDLLPLRVGGELDEQRTVYQLTRGRLLALLPDPVCPVDVGVLNGDAD